MNHARTRAPAFVFGSLSRKPGADVPSVNGTSSRSWETVREAQVAVSEKSPRGEWIDTDDWNGPKNDLRMTPEGYVDMGQRFAGKAIKSLSQNRDWDPPFQVPVPVLGQALRQFTERNRRFRI